MEVTGPQANLRSLGPVQDALEVRPLPSAGVTRFQRYYEPVRLPKRPGLSLTGVRLAHAAAWGLPRCERSPSANMPSPIPRWDRRRDQFAPRTLRQRPSPQMGRVGSHNMWFRGLNGVHGCYGLPARRAARKRPSAPEASASSLPPSPLRLLPAGAKVAGWDLHPRKIAAFRGAPTGTMSMTPPTTYFFVQRKSGEAVERSPNPPHRSSVGIYQAAPDEAQALTCESTAGQAATD
jgi:hypothetical protein